MEGTHVSNGSKSIHSGLRHGPVVEGDGDRDLDRDLERDRELDLDRDLDEFDGDLVLRLLLRGAA